MHERSLIESLVSTVVEKAGAARVRTVRLEVGALTCLAPEALGFCFDVCTNGTPLEGADIDIVEIAGRARCRACGEEVAVDLAGWCCPCGGMDLEVLAGEELRLTEVEVL